LTKRSPHPRSSIWRTRVIPVAIVAATAITVFAVVKLRSPEDPESQPVATVGGRVITLHDFRMNYEFGFPGVKVGNTAVERRRAYLQAMVNELVLASEGYARGLDRRQDLVDRDRELTTGMLTRALIDDEIVKKTNVSDEEVRSAINKSKVQFKVRYWGEPTPEGAEAVRRAMVSSGFSKVIDSLRDVHRDVPIDATVLESGYLNAFEVDEGILSAVKDLQPGGFSAPVRFNEGYYVFQLVDVRRAGLMEHEYATRFESVKRVLLNQKYEEGVQRFVSGFMTERQVTTKGEPFWKLCDAVAEWMRSGDCNRVMLRDAIRNAGQDRLPYQASRQAWDMPIVTHRDGGITIGQLLEFFRPSLREADPSNMPNLRHRMSSEVALAVRDYFLAAEARRRGLDRTPAFVHERELWQSKTLYEAMRSSFVSALPARATPDSIRSFLVEKVDSLKATVPVWVNTAVIDTLHIPESPTSRMFAMQLFNLGDKKPALPIVDGLWGKRP
jgi:hypothetical protein